MGRFTARISLVLILVTGLCSSSAMSAQASKGLFGGPDRTELSASIFGPFEMDPSQHRLVILVTASCLAPTGYPDDDRLGVRYIEVALTNAVSGDELLKAIELVPGARLEVETSTGCGPSSSRCEFLLNGRPTGRFVVPGGRLPILARIAAEVAYLSPPGPGRCSNAHIATSLKVIDRNDGSRSLPAQ